MLVEEATLEICKYFSVLPEATAKKAHGSSPKFTYYDIVFRIISQYPNGLATVFPEVGRTTITGLLPKLFHGKPVSRVLWGSYLLSTIGHKHCSSCKNIKETSEFQSSKYTWDALRSECAVCHNNETAKWCQDNPEKVIAYRQEYYAANKDSLKVTAAKYYVDNKESIDIKHKEYYTKNKETIVVRHREYYEKHKLFYKEYRKEYYFKNKERYLAYSAKRRASKICATPSWANDSEIYRIYLSRREDEHVDHIIPLQGDLVCGLHCENNLQYLSITENLQKGNSFCIDSHIHQVTYTPPYVR